MFDLPVKRFCRVPDPTSQSILQFAAMMTPSRVMEYRVASECSCLYKNVDLVPYKCPTHQDTDPSVLPIPWIVVIFRGGTNENTSQRDQLSAVAATPEVDGNKTSTTGENTQSDSSGDAVVLEVRKKLAAIRFLSLVASCPEYSWRSNPGFWCHVLHRICKVSNCTDFFPRELLQWTSRSCAPARNSAEVREMPKFRLEFRHMPIKTYILELCIQAFSAGPSDIFQKVDQRTEKQLGKMKVVLRQKPQTVDIDLDFSRTKLRVKDSVTAIQDVLKAVNGRDSTSTTTSARIFFKARILNLSETIVAERDLSLLSQVVVLPSLSIRELDLNRVFTAQTSKHFMQGFSEFISACFAVSLTDRSPAISLTKLCLNNCILSAFQLGSLFSAIHEGNSQSGVRELSLRGFGGGETWSWLAFGIFHPDSKSLITRLDLSDCVLRLEDIERVKQLMNSSDCSPYLVQKRNTYTSSQYSRLAIKQWALVQKGTRLEVPRDMKKSVKGPALTLNADMWCEVLDLGVAWACVLVPAYGKLYVKRSNFVKMKTDTEHQSLVRSCKLESLTMAAVNTVSPVLRVSSDGKLRGLPSGQPVDGVLSKWVKTIGQSLRALHLRKNRLTNHTLAVILEACPLLKNLDVSNCELTSIAAITHAFQGGHCVLRTLVASDNRIIATSQGNLFQLLGDQECLTTRSLKVLHLEDNPTSPDNRILTILHSSLLKNKTLRYMALSINKRHIHSHSIMARYNKYHHNEWIGCERPPLPNRLALLSVPFVKTLPVVAIEIVLALAERDIYRQVILQ